MFPMTADAIVVASIPIGPPAAPTSFVSDPDGINSIPLKRIGYLTPNSIQSVADSVKVDKSLKEHGLNIPKRSSYIEQKQNSEEYLRTVEKDSNLLKIGDYVYIHFKKDPMMKSFDLQVQTLQL